MDDVLVSVYIVGMSEWRLMMMQEVGLGSFLRSASVRVFQFQVSFSLLGHSGGNRTKDTDDNCFVSAN